MSFTQRDSTKIWDRIAPVWRERFAANDPNRKYIIDPAIVDILNDVQGKYTLDAGCGEGYLPRILARKGGQVVGVDASKAMLDFAMHDEEREPLGVLYRHGDVARMPFLDDESFYVVVTNLVMDDVEYFEGAFRQFFRVLKPEGVSLAQQRPDVADRLLLQDAKHPLQCTSRHGLCRRANRRTPVFVPGCPGVPQDRRRTAHTQFPGYGQQPLGLTLSCGASMRC
jgi:ubiquinone/menaquinone biosynthesis C-methylase UbiE